MECKELRHEVKALRKHQAQQDQNLDSAIAMLEKAKKQLKEDDHLIKEIMLKLKDVKPSQLQSASSNNAKGSDEEQTLKGSINGYDVSIFGHIKKEKRVCSNCKKMIESGQAERSQASFLPCRWADTARQGHIHAYPPELAAIYAGLK